MSRTLNRVLTHSLTYAKSSYGTSTPLAYRTARISPYTAADRHSKALRASRLIVLAFLGMERSGAPDQPWSVRVAAVPGQLALRPAPRTTRSWICAI